MLSPQAEKWRDVVPSSPTDRFLGKCICHHPYRNKLHKVQESAASVVGDKHQAGKG